MPARKPRTKKQKRAAVREVMDEFKSGTLRSGSRKGPRVRSRQQAIAIALSESGQARRKPGAAKRRLEGKTF